MYGINRVNITIRYLTGPLPSESPGTDVILSYDAVLDLEEAEVNIADPLLTALVRHDWSSDLN